ncbi:MAG: zinc ribbon domain-containing protein [Candidatus Promineifilaceae bacterium]|nr:zinc ribbon domain-containing protein [Candidatus Promineifilaceae bacterium]
MTAGSILLGAALLIVVVLFVARPLLTAEPKTKSNASERQQLNQQKELLLAEIHSLDFDHETGNVPQDVYEFQRSQLMHEAANVLKRLDELAGDADEALRREIEAAVAHRRHQTAHASNGQGSYCHNCGKPLDADDRFCANCGQAVRAVQPTV